MSKPIAIPAWVGWILSGLAPLIVALLLAGVAVMIDVERIQVRLDALDEKIDDKIEDLRGGQEALVHLHLEK